MEALHIAATKSTPEIHFDPSCHMLQVKGQSYPENAFKFYEPVFHWIDEYLADLEEQVTVEIYFHMPYINTSSSKCLMMLLDKMNDAYQAGKHITLKWYYDKENETALDCAEEFKEDLYLPFLIIPVEGEMG